MIDIEAILRTVSAASDAYNAVLDSAHETAELLASQDQPELQVKLRDLVATNLADRARRHAKLIDAAKR